MPSLDSVIEMIKLISLMLFVSSIGVQVWIAVIDVSNFFSQTLEKFRPLAVYDKYSRIAVVIGAFVMLVG
jgi:hypothetical protein